MSFKNLPHQNSIYFGLPVLATYPAHYNFLDFIALTVCSLCILHCTSPVCRKEFPSLGCSLYSFNPYERSIILGLVAMLLQSATEDSQLRWFGNVWHVNNERYPKMVWHARRQGERPRRKAQTNMGRWNKGVVKRKGMDMTQAKDWTEDRARWRALCIPFTPIRRRGSD
jgi:hypothetical protein